MAIKLKHALPSNVYMQKNKKVFKTIKHITRNGNIYTMNFNNYIFLENNLLK